MMKDKKRTFIIIAGIAAALFVITMVYLFISDKNKLSRSEKRWISDNLNVVQNVNVINNVNVFGDNGNGIFYDFLNDFETEYQISINPVTFLLGEEVSGNKFGAGTSITNDSTIFYEDHYVLVGKEKLVHMSQNDFNSSIIGITKSDETYLREKLPNYNYKVYDTNAQLFEGLKNDEVNYTLVSLICNLDSILSNNYVVNYHFGDIKYYFYYEGSKDDVLSSILRKYFNIWSEKYLDELINANELIAFTSALNLTEADITELQSKTYSYGFINQNPYEVITGGNFGGISAVYLKKFSDFAGVDFNFNKYRNYNKFEKALANGKIDIYFNNYNFDDGFETSYTYQSIKYVIIAKTNNNVVINNISTIPKDKVVYVQRGSKIASYLKVNYNLKLKYYDSLKEMFKRARKGDLVALDEEVFSYFHKNKLKNYEIRYEENIDKAYGFRVKGSKAFNTLFSAYISTLDPCIIKYEGINNHNHTVLKGEVLAKLAHYFIMILFIVAIFMLFFYKKSKKVTVAKKIKNDEKIKYIDLLTSLKNRNYLSENMEIWNNNKIYPQTMIVIDLNNIAYLNDTKGYEAGDRQITALANILIKTQLDNSDIMRTNGNEFLIYLVGYQQKHIVNYIHKLSKEMKKLPYEYGAAIGYSMINDDIKTIEDAINEALEDMKKQKPKNKEVKN